MDYKKLPYYQVSVTCDVYHSFTIHFVVSEDLDRVCKFVNYKFELPRGGYIGWDITDFDHRLGLRIKMEDYCPIIWIPKVPKTPEEIGTLYHEIFHAVCDLMRWAHIPLAPESEEAYCHIIGHITREFYTKINKKIK